MTFSLIGRCARTGRLGLGITTYSLAVGGRCEGVAANVGVCKTQAFPNRTNDPLGIKLLAQGYLPRRVMEMFAINDTEHDYRQIAVIDRNGRVAASTGVKNRGWAGHQAGDGYVAMGNVLTGEKTVKAMAEAYEAAGALSFERRLLAAIEAGRDAGGQSGVDGHLPERSAALMVYGDYDHAEIDLRVDLHDTAVAELRRAFEEYDLYRGYYRDRGKNPRDAVPQYQFVAELEKKQQEAAQ